MHVCKIKRYDRRHPGKRISAYPGPMLYFYYHWIPDIFPEIQEKFRDDGSIIHSCKIKRYNPRHPGKRVSAYPGPMLYFYYHWIPDIFPEIQEKFRDDGSIIHSCNKAIPDNR